MPLIRKGPTERSPPTVEQDAMLGLLAPQADARWSAARAAAGLPGGVVALGDALAVEADARVREAIFTSLSRAATAEAVGVVAPYVHSQDAGLRTAALDALRAMPDAVRPHLARMLADPDPDVRLLSCEIARALPKDEASALMCELIGREPLGNVCAAAVEVLAETAGPEASSALAQCAARFAGDPFLAFAIKVVMQRAAAQASPARG